MQFTITPETEIYTNAERRVFVMVDERKGGEVFCRTFKRGEVLMWLDYGSAVRMPEREFNRLLDNENAVRVGVEELTWIPVAELQEKL